MRARLVPRWTGALARLVEITLGIALVIVVAEAIGIIGLFRLGPLVLGLAAVGLGTWFICRHWRAQEPVEVTGSAAASTTRLGLGRFDTGVALAATAVVVGEWIVRTSSSFRHGIIGIDSVWYHLPIAAHFVQTASLTGVQYHGPDAVTAFVPANSELLHAVGILFFGSDLLSPTLNLLWLGLALLAAWCVGLPFGVAPVTLTGAALVLGAPGVVITNAGQAFSDVAACSLLLTAFAILLNATVASHTPRMTEVGIAGLVAGLALGTKFTALAPVAILTGAVIVFSPRRERVFRTSLWLLTGAVGGGFWFIRNFVEAGNPVPFLGFQLGPLQLHRSPVLAPTSAVIEYVTNREAWADYLAPGFRFFLGYGWWAVLALTAISLAVGLFTGTHWLVRSFAVGGIFSAAVFLLAPEVLEYGIPGKPFFFASNVRYLLPALLAAVAVLPLSPVLATPMRARVVLCGFALALGIVQLDWGRIWPTRARPPVTIADGLDSLLALLITVTLVLTTLLVVWTARHGSRTANVACWTMVIAVMLGSGLAVHHVYLDRRYANTGAFSWTRGMHDQRIAISGEVNQYQFYGTDLSNRVQYLGTRGAHGAFLPIDNCKGYRRALNDGRYTYVFVAVDNYPIPFTGKPKALAWTETDPAAHLVHHEGGFWLFRLDGELKEGRCARA
jgi:hypothetical protein